MFDSGPVTDKYFHSGELGRGGVVRENPVLAEASFAASSLGLARSSKGRGFVSVYCRMRRLFNLYFYTLWKTSVVRHK
jgi:hypothetical protein